MQALLSGSDVPEMTDFSKLLVNPPDATALPQAGTQDSWLNALATIGAIAQGGSDIYDRNKAPKPIATNNTGTAPFTQNIPQVRF
jgi:hypothetical protein